MRELNVPLYGGQLSGAGGVGNFRLGFQNLHVPAKPRASLLNQPGGVHQALDGLGEVAHIQQKHHQLGQLQAAA